MNKLLYALTAGAAALVLTSGFSGAADQTNANEEVTPRASENQPGDPSVVKTVPEQANQEQEYLAALKKCDSLKGGEKQTCVESAQRKFSRM
jgi:hypothetical protein